MSVLKVLILVAMTSTAFAAEVDQSTGRICACVERGLDANCQPLDGTDRRDEKTMPGQHTVAQAQAPMQQPMAPQVGR